MVRDHLGALTEMVQLIMDKIFVAIGSYDDKHIVQTVLSALHNAKTPDNVVFGIHNIRPNDIQFDFSPFEKNVRFLNLPYSSPLGTGYARLSASILCPVDCNYILQIDAHMVFEKDWDEDILFRYKEIKKDVDKFIITKYLMQWNEIDGTVQVLKNGVHEICDPYNMSKIQPERNVPASLKYDGIPRSIECMYPSMIGYVEKWSDGETYKEQVGVSGHLMFSESSIIKELLYDPLIPWASDETVYSLRAHTRGYKIFTIRENIAWHLDKVINSEPASRIDFNSYEDPHLKKVSSEYMQSHYYGFKRIKDLMLGNEYGFWGAPNEDLLLKYHEFAKFDFHEFYRQMAEELYKTDRLAFDIIYDKMDSWKN